MSKMTRGSVTVERLDGEHGYLCAVVTLADGYRFALTASGAERLVELLTEALVIIRMDPIVSAERIQKGQEN